MQKKVIVLGAGAFGTAIANLLSDNREEVFLLCHEPEVYADINQNHENSLFLPDVKLNSNIIATNEVKDLLTKDSVVFEAIPVKFLRSVLKKIKKNATEEQLWVCLSKGMEQETFLLPSQIIDDEFGFETKKAALYGPDFAKELGERKFSAADLVCKDDELRKNLVKTLENNYFKTFYSDDLIGLQLGGVIKNILTILIGIAQGKDLGQNFKAFLLTKGFEQSAKLVEILGGKKETIYGLSGFGDLILTATSGLSKNLRAGILLGQRQDPQDLYKYFDVLPEGFNSAESVYHLIQKRNLDLPFFKNAYQVIFEGKDLY
ncbi:MAG: NAD(P)H-dependent glycerol-3-phosphate dehydrogenase [bacterium]